MAFVLGFVFALVYVGVGIGVGTGIVSQHLAISGIIWRHPGAFHKI